MSSELYYPSSEEYLSIGIIGMFLYSVLICLSSLSLMRLLSLSKSKSTKRFFTCIIIMSVCELPRYTVMVITRSYSSEITYCFHIVAGFFFFLAFSIVCQQWSGLLQLGTYFSVVYGCCYCS